VRPPLVVSRQGDLIRSEVSRAKAALRGWEVEELDHWLSQLASHNISSKQEFSRKSPNLFI